MTFDAGAIKSTLELDKTTWEQAVRNVKAVQEALAKTVQAANAPVEKFGDLLYKYGVQTAAEAAKKLETLAADQKKLDEAYRAGVITLPGYQKATNMVAREVKELGGQFGEAQKKSSLLGSVFKSTFGQMSAAMGVTNLATRAIRAIKDEIVDTIQKGREFERAWANVTTQLGDSAEEAGRMKDALLKMSPHLGGATELAKGMYEVLSASIEPAKAIEFLGTAAKSAKAGLADTKTAVDALTTVINAYGLEAEDATRISDIMFQSVKLGKQNYEQMASALGTVVPIAAQVGIQFEDIAAAMSSLTRKGIDANTATVQLRQILVSVLKPEKQAADLAKQIGLEFNAQALAAKGLVGFLQDVQEKTGGSSEEMTVLFGNVRALTGVMGLAAEGAAEFSKDLDAMKNSVGMTDQAFKKQMDSLDFWLETYQTSLDKLKISFYDGLVTPIRDALKSAGDLADMVGDLQTGVQAMGEMLGTLALPVIREVIDKLQQWAATLKLLPIYLEVLNQVMHGHAPNLDAAIRKYALIQIALGKWGQSTRDTKGEITSLADVMDRARTYYVEHAAMIIETAKSSKEAADQIDALKRFIRSGGEAAEGAGGKVKTLADELGILTRTALEAELKKWKQALVELGANVPADELAKIEKTIKEIEDRLKANVIGKTAVPAFRDLTDIVKQAVPEFKDLYYGAFDFGAALTVASNQAKVSENTIKRFLWNVRTEFLRTIGIILPKWESLFDDPSKKQKGGGLNEWFQAKFGQTIEQIQAVTSAVDAAIQQGLTNKLIALDNYYQAELDARQKAQEAEQADLDAELEAEIERINASQMSEEEKQAAILAATEQANKDKAASEDSYNQEVERIEAEYELKRREAQKKAAEAQKITAIANAVINVAEGITKAWGQGGIFGAIMAAIVAAAGAIQIAKIKSTPIPLAQGAVFDRRTRLMSASTGQEYDVAEAGEAEILTSKRKVREAFGLDARGGAGTGGVIHVHVHNYLYRGAKEMNEQVFKIVKGGTKTGGLRGLDSRAFQGA